MRRQKNEGGQQNHQTQIAASTGCTPADCSVSHCMAYAGSRTHATAAAACLQFLVSQGFTNVKNVTGGIAAYSMVDRSVPEY
jgi:hypothetical protein